MIVKDIAAFRRDLLRDLRFELGHLKTCQTQLLVFSSASAGLYLGLIPKGEVSEGSSQLTSINPAIYFLLPLLFLLPLFIIFYDKARIINRIVGFLRVQEKLLTYRSDLAVIGLESALEKYRAEKSVFIVPSATLLNLEVPEPS